MTTNPFFVRLRFLRVYTSIVCFCFVQSVCAQLEISSSVPTSSAEALHVGVGTAQFELEIVNSSSPLTIETIELSQPVGVRIVSAEYELDGMSYPASVTEHTILVHTVLQPSQHMKITYHKTANCEVVPQASSGFSVSVIDNISVITDSYTEQVESNSYPVLFPGLIMNTPESPNNNKTVVYRESFTDSINISNSENAGKVTDMVITMTWDNSSAITVTGMQIDGIGNVPFEPKPNGNSVEVILNKTTLADLGFTDSVFIADAEIVLRPTFFVNEYFVDLKTTYAVDYLAEGDVCNRNKNSEGIIYYVQQYPDVYGYIDPNPDILQLANWCGNSYIANFTIRSVADVHQSNIIRNCYLEFTTKNNYVKIDIVEVNGVVLQEDGGKWYLPINDLDGDNIHSDLYPGDSLVVKITASSLYTTPHSMFSVFLRYQRIDSDEYLQHGFSVGGFIRYTSSNISSPADINEGDVAAYTYNFTTEGDNYLNTSPHAFLNTEKIYAQFDYTGEQINQTLAVKISGAENFSATAECGMSQTARLVMVTAGCPDEKFTVTSATGNAIIQCEGEGGACYGIYTDTVEALTATEINTCQALELKAPGHIDRWCRDTCANFSKIIARVYDLSGKLSISGGSSIIEINGQSIDGVLNNSYASHNGVAWVANAGIFECIDTILNHDTLTLTATIKVNGDHSLPDLSNVNLRIEFAAIDINNELLEGGWSKGLPIIVYDPETSFGADFDNYGCSGLRLHASMKNGANGAPAHPSVINSVLYPLVENYYYEKLGSNTPNASTETTYDKSLYPGGNFTLQEALFPICVKDSTLTPSATLQVNYTDYYATCADKSFTKNLTREANLTGIALMPTLTLHPTETQQNIEDFTTWTVQVENTGTAPAKNVMLKFEVDTLGNDVVLEIVEINGAFINPPSTLEYYNIGYLSSNSQTEVTIKVKYSNCTAQDTSRIFVNSAWACESFDVVDFDTFSACSDSTVLELENLVAVLSATETFPNEYYNLCEDIPVSFTIDNIGRANLTQLGVWFEEFPSNYSLTDSQIDWNFGSNSGSLVDEYVANLDRTIDLFLPNKDISMMVLGNEDIEDTLSALEGIDPTITMDFNVQLHCGDLDTVITFFVRGVTNCGAVQKKYFRFKPKIKGFEYLDSIGVSASIDTNIFEYEGIRNFTASVTNLSQDLIDSAYITVTVPYGLQYRGYNEAKSPGVVGVEVTEQDNGTQKVRWKLEEGVHLAVGDTVTVEYQLQAESLCGNDLVVLTQGTLLRKLIDCNGIECDAVNSTAATSVTVTTVKPDFSASISGDEFICVDNTVHYEVEGVGIQSLTWGLSPESAGVLTQNGLNASVLYSETGTATVTATVVGQCESRDLNVQTKVLSVPVVSIDPVSSITWKDWSEQGVSIIDNTLPVENWEIPEIDTCGIYELAYSETNQCGSAAQTVPIEIIRCCDTIVIELADTITISIDDWNTQQEALIPVSPTNGTWTSVPAITDCGTYTLVYTVTNECDTVHKEIIVEIDGCCIPEEIDIPADTLTISYAEWLIFDRNSIGVSPAGGTWQTLQAEPHGMCGEYVYEYTIETCGSVDSDTIVILVEECCTDDPEGDIALTEMEGVTTFDVEVLEYYIEYPESVIQVEHGYETYYMEMIICGELVRVELVQCFPKWANINGIGDVDEVDVEALKQLVR